MIKIKNKFILTIMILHIGKLLCDSVPLYFCTAASGHYFNHTLNLIGSIHAVNFNELQEIAIFDLGLSNEQINYLNKIQKAKVYKFEPFNPETTKVLRWFMWKPVVIHQALNRLNFPYVLWTDAGTTILKPIDSIFKHIIQNKYFICTIGNEFINGKWRHPVSWGTTKFVKQQFNLDATDKRWVLDQEFVMGGIIGSSKEGYNIVIKPLYDLSPDIRYFQDDGTAPNGYGCARHDQTLLSITAYLNNLNILKQDYTQNTPMQLKVDGNNIPFNITWHPDYVSDKTHMYSSRGDLRKKDYFLSKIRYR